jgi:hypothetical protein
MTPSLNSQERVRAAIRHQTPDRTPVIWWLPLKCGITWLIIFSPIPPAWRI